MQSLRAAGALVTIALAAVVACSVPIRGVETESAVEAQKVPAASFDSKIDKHATEMIAEGRKIFRYDTFGSETFWGDNLHLQQAIAGEKLGGVGAGISPRQALQLGLKVDVGAVPKALVEVLKGGAVSLDNPETTVELLKANAVVGVTGFFDQSGKLTSMGIQCSFCHSTVDNSFASGIGRRLDGWPNRDLNVGAIVSAAPNLQPLTDYLGVDKATLLKVLASWGPGRYDAEVNQDLKAARPDGKSAATLIPAAFGSTPIRAGAAFPTGMPMSPSLRCTARACSSIRGSTTPRNSRSPRATTPAISATRRIS